MTEHFQSPIFPMATAVRGGIKYPKQLTELQAAQRENKILRRIIERHAEDARMVRRQESIHDYCEGHALCDLVSACEWDAKSLPALPERPTND